ncbi:MAG: S-layer homology domain-containing protein [Vallitalea sp.]|jgi:hypothetical protein|nr:S-layer homology domain-containing protein [Vallitalea sp.]
MKINFKYKIKKILAFCLIASMMLNSYTYANDVVTETAPDVLESGQKADKLVETGLGKESEQEEEEAGQEEEESGDINGMSNEELQNNIDELTQAIDGLVEVNKLEDGYYRLPMSSWQRTMINRTEETCSAREAIKNQALLKVDNGEYEVTFAIRESNKVHAFGIVKDEYYGATWYGQKLGTKNWRRDFDFNGDEVHDNVKPGNIDENNKYWVDYTTDYIDSENNIRYITFSPTDLTTNFRMHFYGTVGKNGDVDFSEAVAKKIDIEDIKKMNKMKYSVYAYNQAPRGIEDCFTKEAIWEVNDNIAVAKIVLDDSVNEKHKNIKIGLTKSDLSSIEQNSFELEFDLSNYRDVVLGKTVYIETTNTDGYSDEKSITIYPEITNKQNIEIEEQTTVSKICTNTDVILPDAQLVKSDIIDTPSPFDAYTMITSKVPDEQKIMFNLHINENGKKEIRFSDEVEVKFKIPEGWDKYKVRLFECVEKGWWGKTGKLEETENGSYLVVKTRVLGSYALYQEENYTATGENLEEGTYKIPVKVFKMKEQNDPSMSDVCLGDKATLIVKDNIKTLYLDFSPVQQMNSRSYMTKMNLYGEDMEMQGGNPSGTLKPIVVTSFYRKDGSFLTDLFNEDTINYYPKTGYIQLVSDEHRWPVRFSVPIMDAIASNDSDKDALLALYWKEANKISDETSDVPIKKALKELINIGDVIPSTNRLTNVTEDVFYEALENAKEVDANNEATLEQINKAYSELKESIDDINGYKIIFYSGVNGNIDAHVDGQRIVSGGKLVPKGKTVVFTATPDEGYVINSWSGINEATSSNVVNMKVDNKSVVSVNFKEKDSGSGQDPSGGGSQGGISLEEGNYYYVGISLWHASNDQASMGNASFNNNRKALVYVNNDGSYSIQVCTNPITINDITAGIGSIFSGAVNNLTVVSTEQLTNGEDYISKFTFDIDSKNEYYPITVTVPGSPMMGDFDARLRFDWDNISKTSTTNLTPYCSSSTGQTPSVDTDKPIKENDKDKKSEQNVKKFKQNDLKTLIKKEKKLIVEDKSGVKAKFDIKSIKAITEKAGPNNVTVEISKAKSSQLNDKQKKVAGNRPVYSFIVEANNKKITNFGEGEVEITLPYTLKIGEKGDSLVVWYIDDNGKIEKINCTYDAKTKTVTFKTNHFSIYAIAHKEIKVWKNPFTDIRKSDVYYDDISYIAEKGLFNGTSKSTFSPQLNLSRAMFVTVLWRLEGSPDVDLTNVKFSDVVKGSYYEKAVGWAKKNGIVSENKGNEFSPNEDITIEQLAIIMQRYAKYTDNYEDKAVNLEQYIDYTDISTYAKDAMEWALAINLVKAADENTILPKRTIIRAKAAQILTKFLKD